MSRLVAALALLAALLVPASAGAAPQKIGQADWNKLKRHVVLANGIRLTYVELGDPAGSPVLLLHGFTDSSRAWSLLAPHLMRHRLLIPDQRGHGGSDRPRCCYALSDLTDDAVLFLDAMKVERAAVVGHSMGSMVAQALAAHHPGRVDRIVLAGSTALVPVKPGDWLWKEVMALDEPIASNARFLREWSPAASPTAPLDAAFVRHVDAEIAAVPLHVWRGFIRELSSVPAGRFAADVRAPVQILSAGRDVMFPADHHRSLLAAYPGAEAHVFPELGHNLVYERPDEIGPRLARFLGRGGPQGAASR